MKVSAMLLLCLTTPGAAFSQVYDIAGNQELAKPVESYQRAKSERLQQEHIRLQNERLRRENLRREQESQLAGCNQLLESEARGNNGTRLSTVEKITVIAELHRGGLLTDSEFETLKQEILAAQ